MSTTPDILTPHGSTPTGVFADASGYLSAVEVHDPASQQSASWSGGTSKHKPKALDLFCCEGGAGMGYALAGCDVTGVDIVARPRYPFAFVLGDALEYLEAHGHEYDLIHASPPCQGYSHLTPAKNRGDHEKLIPAVRALMKKLGKPYVIENVAGARRELENPVMLCGSMFGLRTQRHRYFETSVLIGAPCDCDHSTLPLLVTTASKASREKRFALGMKPKSVKNAPEAYGIGWMSCDGLKEAIPPAFTEFIGRRILAASGFEECVSDLPKGESPCTEGRKDNAEVSDRAGDGARS